MPLLMQGEAVWCHSGVTPIPVQLEGPVLSDIESSGSTMTESETELDTVANNDANNNHDNGNDNVQDKGSRFCCRLVLCYDRRAIRLAKARPPSSGHSAQTDNHQGASGRIRKGAATGLPLWIWRRASMEDIKVIKQDVQQNRNT